MTPVLQMEKITKVFRDNRANDNIDFDLRKGEIHALLGENGAGKSTLMNILYGMFPPSSGSIYINGEKVEITSPLDAIAQGIGMVHQHFMLIPALTVLENVIMGMSDWGLFIDKRGSYERILRLAQQNGLKVDPDERVADLSVGMQQQVEILKALYRGAKILILDEPTGVLTPQEAHELFKTLKELARDGLSIIFISHKLDEVMELSDRASILRDGKMVKTLNTKDTNARELANYMVGREVVFQVHGQDTVPGETVLSVSDLCVKGINQASTLKNVSFDIRAGEILGVAGIDGNGQSELARAVTGLARVESGDISLNGESISNLTARQIESKGVAFIPEDRKEMGIIRHTSIDKCLIMRRQDRPPFCVKNVLQTKLMSEHADKVIEDFDIRMTGRNTNADQLSGGNMQKVVLAREILADPKLLVAMHPTRGLDVGAIEFIHAKLFDARARGAALMVISTEIEEILTLSDRILVLCDGKVTGIVDKKTTTENELGILMGGNTITAETKEAQL